ncbi:fructose 1,6-bisphosphatase [uncultured Desulfosarcina sp.]|uniref:fructose 1,6-bisphosphatase n=1 Tax=uncultured Desulfosarcina sp. TaxID=218289 RepID=UPI0029C745DD|nr:fructose 1,6-bisphosphatase [uncultured Desulfosarcina sp.]
METFSFKLDGPIFSKGVPIHVAIKAWENFQSIIDKSYLVATQTHRIGKKERERFFLQATSFEHSSFLTNTEIILSGVQLALPLVTVFGPQNLWEYTLESFNFLKLICSHKEDPQGVKIDVKDNTQTNVHIGDIVYNFNGPVFPIAEKALPKYQDLAHMLDEGKVEEISAGKKDNPEMTLTLDDKKLFELPTKVEDDPIELKCEIFTFNKFNNVGKLRITDGQTIPSGDYNFSIYGNQDNVNYIYSMLKPLVSVKCLLEIAISPLGVELIHHLHITGIVS